MTTLPEINFLETNAEKLTSEFVNLYEELEGRKLAQADPLHLIFLTAASVITKQNVAINDAAKQNLLYYARDEVLDHKGAEMTTPRLQATAAKTVLRIHLSTMLQSSRVIDKGTLATSNEGAIFFATTEEIVIPTNVMSIDVELACTIPGEVGNNFSVGQINTLVKPLPYVSKIENITLSAGGAEKEENEPYRERIYQAPEKLTNAGSEGAYEYFAKSASALIGDVHVHMPQPGYVHISVLLKNGELPTEEIIDMVLESVTPKKVRPLTDNVTVGAPIVKQYNLDLTYYIDTNAVDKNIIQEKVQQAIDDWILWQQTKIGRDINPSKLVFDCVKAGAKRIDVINPIFTKVDPGEVAQINLKSITFGGVEDD